MPGTRRPAGHHPFSYPVASGLGTRSSVWKARSAARWIAAAIKIRRMDGYAGAEGTPLRGSTTVADDQGVPSARSDPAVEPVPEHAYPLVQRVPSFDGSVRAGQEMQRRPRQTPRPVTAT